MGERRICLLGLGYIGLPTAVMLAEAGNDVVGVDVNEGVVETLRAGELHIEEPGLKEALAKVVAQGTLTFSTKPCESDVFIIAVPTPVKKDKTADLSYVEAATESISPYLRKGNVVILESTVPPRTVEDVMIPILQRTGLAIGSDLYIAHSPERVLPGRILEELVNNNRVVGGINPESTRRAKSVYETFVQGKIFETDATTAEMVKLMENAYRDVNIALANELGIICEKLGINVWEAINLANHHPRVNVHRPGPGVGGHCIAVDPWFIVEAAPQLSRLIRLSRETNDAMPQLVLDKVAQLVPKSNAKVAAFGLAFKGNVDDVRESPAIKVIEKLQNLGYEVACYDPHVRRYNGQAVNDLSKCVEEAELILILTDHKEFTDLSASSLIGLVKRGLVLDTRACLNRSDWETAGFEYYLLGDGHSFNEITEAHKEAAITAES